MTIIGFLEITDKNTEGFHHWSNQVLINLMQLNLICNEKKEKSRVESR